MQLLKAITFTRLFLLVLLLMSIYSLAVGAVAYINPSYFFIETAAYTGEFNPHFVRDVGAAFLTAGVMLLLAFSVASWRTPCAIAGALFLFLHGLIHWQELWQVQGEVDRVHVFSEIVTVLLPAVMVVIAIILDCYRTRR